MDFKLALKTMMDEGEFDKIIKGTKGKNKKAAKEFYSLIKDNKDFDMIPVIPLLMACNSLTVLKDAIIYMTAIEK